jgi:RHS repeat-associated protein
VQLSGDTNASPSLDVRKDIAARNASAPWDDANNPVTITRTFATGPFKGAVHSIDRPDGTRTLRSYTPTTEEVSDGAAGTGFTVTDGRRTSTTKTGRGYVQTDEVFDILSGKKLVSDVWSAPNTNDPQGRFTLLIHLDGTTEIYTYDCCNLTQVTDRDGATTVFTPDALKRPWKTTVYYSATLVNGIETRNTLDAQGNVTRITRVGADSTSIDVLPLREYDRGGRVVREQNALGGYTTIVEGTNAAGGRKLTTTYPDGGTRIEEYYRDGRLAKLYGTAVREPAQYEYLLSASGELVTKETKLDAGWSPTSQWTKTYTDFLGREYKTVYADATTGDESDNPYSQRFFKDNGQLWKERDPDGVLTVSIFNARGEIEYTMAGQKTEPTTPPTAPDTTGEHRITRVERFVTNYTDGVTYDTLLTRVTEWTNLNSANTIVSSETHTSLDGLREWSVAYPHDTFKQVVKTVTQYGGGGARTVTTTYPDNSYQISLFSYGRPASVTRYPSSGNAISQTTYQHDAHGRLWSSTDARNGTTTFYYNSADLISSVISPPPTNGQPAQTRTIAYDLTGRPYQVTEPDSGVIYTRYYSNGLVKLTWGARTVPTGYEFDGQGRVTKLFTWQSFTAPDPGLSDPPFPSGAVTTLLHYDPYRGWPIDKRYADSTGPDYTYTPSGLPKTRSWWRSVPGSPGTRITVTNAYDFEAAGSSPNRKAGYLARIDYNDGTAGVTFDYDRRGRARTVTQGSGGSTITTALAWHPAGPLDSESYAGSFLDTLSVAVDNFDAANLLRRESLEARKAGAAIGGTVTYSYDNAWRLQSLANGANSLTYGYAANSDLIATNTFKQGGTPRLTATRQFDFLNRLTQIESLNSQPSTLNRFSYAYNSANQRTSRGEANGAYWLFGYDELGQNTSGKKYWSDGAPVAGQQFEYTFDWIGNRLSTAAGGDERGTALRAAAYSANTLNQYTQRTVPTWVSVQGEASSNTTVTVNLQPTKRQGDYYWMELWFNNSTGAVYQSITNVAAFRRTNQPDVVSTVVGSLFQPKTPELFLHDADGNLTNDGRWTLTWDAENRLSRAETIGSALASGVPRQRLDLASDYLGRRVRKSVSNYVAGVWQLALDHRYLYDGWNLIAILDSSQTLLYSFTWGTDLSGSLQGAGGVGGLISMTVQSGPLTGTYFYCYDGNGNVVALVNAADGTIAAQYDYGPFGDLLRVTGPLALINPFRFSTKFQDDETGFLYYGHRYYNPSTGRWLSRDLIANQGASNLYAAFQNAPPNVFDPDGRDNMYFQSFPGYSQSVQNAPVNFEFTKTYQTRLVYRPSETSISAPGTFVRNAPGYYERIPTGDITFASRALGTDPLAAAIVYAPRAIAALHTFSVSELIERSNLPQDQKARLHFLNASGQLLLLLTPCKSAGTTRLSAAEGPYVLFGQRRVGRTFSRERDVPDYLRDRLITDVAADLRSGVLSPDQLPIQVFSYEGQLVTLNNRSLAALGEARIRPTRVEIVEPTLRQRRRLLEPPIIDSPIPGPLIPMTPSQSDLTILHVIEAPR